MKLKLPDSISSSQDLKALTLEVREYGKWFSHNAIKMRAGAKNVSKPPELSKAASEVISLLGRNPSTQSIDELLATLHDYESTAPSLSITLAAPPTAGIKETLVGWCRNNVAPNVLVSFHFNATLLGGMVIRYGSRIFDWSFRRQILDARAEFPKVLKNV